MAEILSTISPAGDQGTPENGGGFYLSISSWYADQSGVHTLSDNSRVECYKGDYGGDNGQLLDNANLVGFDTSPTSTVTIAAAAGSEVNARTGNSAADYFCVYQTGALRCLQANNYIVFQDIRVSTGTHNAIELTGGAYAERCVVTTLCTSAARGGFLLNNAESFIRNCLVINEASGNNSVAITVGSNGGDRIENTLMKTGSGVAGAVNNNSQVVTYTNTISITASTSAVLNPANCTGNNCYVSTSTAPAEWPGSVTDISETAGVDFINPAIGDWNPQPGGKLDGTGVTIGTFTDDAVRFTRIVPWEGGPLEIQGAAPGVTFDGPDIVAQAGTEGQVFSFDENGEGTVASRFTGATSYAYAPGSDQPAGITVNATTGNLEGTPTESGVFNVMTIQGSD